MLFKLSNPAFSFFRLSQANPTGVHEETLTHIGKRCGSGPPNASDFKVHRGIERMLSARLKGRYLN